jgi:magnesium chelatase subunit D
MSPFDPHWESAPPPLTDAVHAAALLAIDPALGGVVIRSWSGPARDAYVQNAIALRPGPVKKMPLGIADDRLLGGLDLTATLAAGRPVQSSGLLQEAAGGLLIVAMADRLSAGIAARLAGALDQGCLRILALDEGAGPDEAPPAALLDRLAFTLHELPMPGANWPSAGAIHAAGIRLAGVTCAAEGFTQIVALAAAFGVGSARAEFFALRAARAAAALRAAPQVEEADIALAARLVLAPRATQLPSAEPPAPPPPEDDEDEQTQQAEQEPTTLEDQVAEAEKAALPAHLLAALAAHTAPRRAARGAGTSGAAASLKRGRPIGARRGALKGQARLSLLDTLRAAAPWQRLRQPGGRTRIAVRAEDFHIKRFKENPRHVTIFAVDASGSSALNRLAEAKGAIQLLLAECYVRRDEVALIAFRGTAAELLLPPTPALARARRALSALPGGGPTPLSHGIAAATALAMAEKRAGKQPLLVLLTDGGANIGQDGEPGRAAAGADALKAACACAGQNFAALVVDTSPRKNPAAAALAAAMRARYLPLPYADSARLSAAVQAEGAGRGRAAA